ncbi:hypothetical protein HOV23_gp131 [Pseudomonas phage Lana]|uniref:Uncharacterized protein n=1 Tax=Pseudomonas phage Lana TaxID=2530172 RepID=A0A481W7P2_9CAUD|nr:hypothetical protein HOV23_gp131 [Pseudomonas phage Lana]QBJ04442.1 hypothetical protein [Pseudomonas phage Lana]
MATRIKGITEGLDDPGWDMVKLEPSTAEHPAKYKPMANPPPVTNLASLKYADRQLFDAIELLMTNLKLDMLPDGIQADIVAVMSATTKRQLVQQMAGLDASVLVTFKQQLALIEAVTSRVVSPEGLPLQGHGLDISVKDAMNMSMKVIGMLVKDMPKVITLARVQRLENSLLKVVETLPKKAQDDVLRLLEEEEMKAAREAK